MAACNLLIRLDEPNRVYFPGELIRGCVEVSTTSEVRCDKLEIVAAWRTHGFGNVDAGKGDSCTPFTGTWSAGSRESYRFELMAADWPPSYHGEHINIDHCIDVRVHIPWGFDAKASEVYLLESTQTLQSKSKDPMLSDQGSGLGLGTFSAIVGGVLVLLLMLSYTVPVAPFFAIPIGIVIFLYALIKHWMPWWVLGEVKWNIKSQCVARGEKLHADIRFHPRKAVRIDSITATLKGQESAVKGSGSNRRTKTHEVFDKMFEIVGATQLPEGLPTDFALVLEIPGDAPLSFDLSNNDLDWSVEFRVAIASWPDWTRSVPVQVIAGPAIGRPTESGQMSAMQRESDQRDRPTTSTSESPASVQSGGISLADSHSPSSSSPSVPDPETPKVFFGQVMAEVAANRSDDEKVHAIVNKVAGVTLTATVKIDRRLLYLADEEDFLKDGESAWWAEAGVESVPLVLYVDDETSSYWRINQPEHATGKVEFVGYCTIEDRVRLRWKST